MKKVLIVGGGIAGLSSAILLEKAGYEVEIAEKADKWEPVGAGIVLWPNALKVLEACNVRDDVEIRGNILQKMNVVDRSGKRITGFDFTSISRKEKLYAVGIFRPELHNALVNGLKNTKVIPGTSIDSLTDENDCVSVQLTNGVTKEYDFVIGADGINSTVRSLIFGETKLRYSGDSGWRFITNTAFNDNTAYEMWGNVKRFGIVPIGNNKLYCFSIINSGINNEKYRNLAIGDYKYLYSELGWKAKDILNSLPFETKLIYNDLHDLRLKRWYKGNVVLIGDAAHAVTPNLGSGAAMAMEDALSLTQALYRNDTPEAAFKEYFQSRYKRVNYIRNASYWLGKARQLNNFTGKIRNIFMRTTGSLTAPYIVKKITGIK